ncbi:alpha/beta hydrolase [Microlunatus elymi]|uniref:Alpha/beta hydrolase n=1 Tax=Microlunatus elymi TaxID=2596828 RepID=A0A516PWN6_9ACTN|nr:alpha/beta hydrolase [Microlunatus elymi]QDP95594.1 alpha/beta hydrolase [Microlunatus elymi]
MSRRSGVGLVAGAATLAVGGFAVGLKLERALIGRRLRSELAEPQENFFALRSDGVSVQTPDGVRLHAEVDPKGPEPAEGPQTRPQGPEPVEGPQRNDRGPELVEGPRLGSAQPTLVFVHGYALSLDCWHFQRKHFRGRYRMIFYDQRSHGRSGRSSPDRCRIPQLADDLAQILREVAGPGPVILIGHSMGGMTIMELARQHPAWFTGDNAAVPVDGIGPIIGVGLVCTSADDLLDPHPVRGLPSRAAARLAEPAMAALNRIPTVVEQTRQAGSDLAYLVTRGMTFPSPVPPSYVQFMSDMLGQTPLEVVADFYPAFAELDQAAGLAVINTVPTAVVGARQDLVTPYRHTGVILDHLPAAEKLILDQSGHMAMIEHHQKVNTFLDRLIDRATQHITRS